MWSEPPALPHHPGWGIGGDPREGGGPPRRRAPQGVPLRSSSWDRAGAEGGEDDGSAGAGTKPVPLTDTDAGGDAGDVAATYVNADADANADDADADDADADTVAHHGSDVPAEAYAGAGAPAGGPLRTRPGAPHPREVGSLEGPLDGPPDGRPDEPLEGPPITRARRDEAPTSNLPGHAWEAPACPRARAASPLRKPEGEVQRSRPPNRGGGHPSDDGGCPRRPQDGPRTAPGGLQARSGPGRREPDPTWGPVLTEYLEVETCPREHPVSLQNRNPALRVRRAGFWKCTCRISELGWRGPLGPLLEPSWEGRSGAGNTPGPLPGASPSAFGAARRAAGEAAEAAGALPALPPQVTSPWQSACAVAGAAGSAPWPRPGAVAPLVEPGAGTPTLDVGAGCRDDEAPLGGWKAASFDLGSWAAEAAAAGGAGATSDFPGPRLEHPS